MRSIAAFIAAVIALCAFTLATATTVVQLSIEDLVDASDVIVVGTIDSVTCFEEKGRVFTRVTVRPDETLKGEERKTLEIVHIGGRTDHLATRVAGMPSFVDGERALLFLEQPKGVAHFVVTGLAQGKLDLVRTDGAWQVKQSLEDLHTVRPVELPTGEIRLQPSTPQPIAAQSLDALRTQITRLVSKK